MVVSESNHTHTSGIIALNSITELTIGNSAHSHTSDTLNLAVVSDLDVDGSSHTHTSETIDLIVNANVIDSVHGQMSDEIALGTNSSLIVGSSVCDHTSDLLNFPLVLNIVNSYCDHSSETLILTLLRVFESLHSHASDKISLSTIVTLNIKKSNHSHGSSLIVLHTKETKVSDILIYRDLQIIDRQVCEPPSYPVKTIGYFDIPDSFVVSLTKGTGYETGSHFGTQHFLRIVGITPGAWYDNSPFAAVGPVYLQRAKTTAKVSRTPVQIYQLEPVKVAEEETSSTLPAIKVDKKRSRILRRQ
jgi:hypothetical protein